MFHFGFHFASIAGTVRASSYAGAASAGGVSCGTGDECLPCALPDSVGCLGFQATGVGTLELAGGSVSAESVTPLAGTGHMTWTGGSLQLSTGVMVGGGWPIGINLTMSPGMDLQAGNVYVASDGRLSMLGGSVRTDFLSVSGEARLLGGSCQVTNMVDVCEDGLPEIAYGQSISAPAGATLHTNGKLILGGSLGSRRTAERVVAAGMNMKQFDDVISAHARVLWLEQQRAEIERAIDNVKRSAWDKRFRKQWHRAAAMRKWPRRHAGDMGRWFE